MAIKPTFVEREPYEKGFGEVFEREIVPKLHETEQRRLDRLRRTKLRIVAVVNGVVVAAAAMYLFDLWRGTIFLIVFLGGGAY